MSFSARNEDRTSQGNEKKIILGKETINSIPILLENFSPETSVQLYDILANMDCKETFNINATLAKTFFLEQSASPMSEFLRKFLLDTIKLSSFPSHDFCNEDSVSSLLHFSFADPFKAQIADSILIKIFEDTTERNYIPIKFYSDLFEGILKNHKKIFLLLFLLRSTDGIPAEIFPAIYELLQKLYICQDIDNDSGLMFLIQLLHFHGFQIDSEIILSFSERIFFRLDEELNIAYLKILRYSKIAPHAFLKRLLEILESESKLSVELTLEVFLTFIEQWNQTEKEDIYIKILECIQKFTLHSIVYSLELIYRFNFMERVNINLFRIIVDYIDFWDQDCAIFSIVTMLSNGKSQEERIQMLQILTELIESHELSETELPGMYSVIDQLYQIVEEFQKNIVPNLN